MCPSLIEIGSKTTEKKSAQTNRQTNRHYENNGHLAVNQKCPMNKNVKPAMILSAVAAVKVNDTDMCVHVCVQVCVHVCVHRCTVPRRRSQPLSCLVVRGAGVSTTRSRSCRRPVYDRSPTLSARIYIPHARHISSSRYDSAGDSTDMVRMPIGVN